MKKISLVLLLALAITACQTTTEKTEIRTVSEMRKVMMGEDLSAHIRWDTLSQKNLFAVCPLGRIQGEVTIIDGEMYTSEVTQNNTIAIKRDWNIQSPFAVYAYVKEWETVEVDAQFANEEELQAYIEKVAQNMGKDLSTPFVFRILGTFDSIDYHIISKPVDEKEHSHALHNQAKKHFSLQNVSGELLGFYSQNHEGVFTHRGYYIHTHFLDNQKLNMGHLEGAKATTKLKIQISK